MPSRIGAATVTGGRNMEIICHRCEGNAFRILPEEYGIVAAECVVCGTLTLIEIPKPALGAENGHCRAANGYGHRHDRPQ
jgi:hypothetical protein